MTKQSKRLVIPIQQVISKLYNVCVPTGGTIQNQQPTCHASHAQYQKVDKIESVDTVIEQPVYTDLYVELPCQANQQLY